MQGEGGPRSGRLSIHDQTGHMQVSHRKRRALVCVHAFIEATAGIWSGLNYNGKGQRRTVQTVYCRKRRQVPVLFSEMLEHHWLDSQTYTNGKIKLSGGRYYCVPDACAFILACERTLRTY